MDATTRAPSPWPRRLCAVLFASGGVIAAAMIILHGLHGLPLGLSIWALAWVAAARADPSKWPP